jgi:hypothetical protein
MATLKEIIQYSTENPNTDYAKGAYSHIVNGDFDDQAQKEGIDLSKFGRPALQKAPEKPVGMVQGLVQDIVKTPLNVASTVASAGKGLAYGAKAIGQYAMGDKAGALQSTIKAGQPVNLDAGYLGKGKPIESAKEAVGAGLEMGSYAVGGGGAGKLIGQTVKGALKQGIKTGFQSGLVGGATGGAGVALQKENSTVNDVLAGIGFGGAGGAILGTTLGTISPLISKTLQGKTVKEVQVALTKLDPQVQTIVKETPIDTLNKYADQAQRAMQDPRVKTPFEMAGQSAKNALSILDEKLSAVGKNKAKATKEIDNVIEGTPAWRKVEEIAFNAKTSLKRQVAGLGLKVQKDGTITQATGKVSKIPLGSSDIKLLKQSNEVLQRAYENPTFSNLDNAIDSVQDILYKRKGTMGAEPVNKELEGLLKHQIGMLNTNLKNYGTAVGNDFPLSAGKFGDYTKMNAEFSKAIQIKNQLNKVLGDKGVKSGSLVKRFFSPSDAGTKDLFETIKNETGIDLAQEATIARFVMDIFGDTRQKMLLKEIPTSKEGVIGGLLKKGWEKTQNPLEKARSLTK